MSEGKTAGMQLCLSLHYNSCSRHVITRSNDFLCSLHSKEFTHRAGYIEDNVTPSAVKHILNYETSLQLKKIKSQKQSSYAFEKHSQINKMLRFKEAKLTMSIVIDKTRKL